MIYKIGFFLGAALIAILAVENMVIGIRAYIFLDKSASAGMLVIISAVIGMIMGYCVPIVFGQKQESSESFNEF